MRDKNGTELRTGMIVQISGAYFKNDNGLFFIARSPGDPGWFGAYHSLHKISKAGKISHARYNLCSWPIRSYVSDRYKTALANDHNREHAAIEVTVLPNMQEVKAYFQKEADDEQERIDDYRRRFGWDDKTLSNYIAYRDHHQAVADGIK